MTVNHCFHAPGATTADVDAASTEDPAEVAAPRKMLIKQAQKISAGPCEHTSVETGAKPDHTSFAVTFAASPFVNKVVP